MSYFLYVPTKGDDGNSLRKFFQTGEDILLKTKDNVLLDCYFLKQKFSKKAPTILFLHGNAGSIHQRGHLISKLFLLCSANVFALSYRGYGKSTGKPSETGLKKDTKYAFEYLLEQEIDTEQIYVYGQSLGGACAFSLLKEYSDKICGLIVENTFLSIEKIIREKIFYLSRLVSYLFKDNWDTESLIKNFKKKKGRSFPKIMFLSAENDEIFSSNQMKLLFISLYDILSKEERKKMFFVSFYNAGHNNTWKERDYFKYIFIFLYCL